MGTLYIDRQGSQLNIQTGVLHITTPNGEADRRLPLKYLDRIVLRTDTQLSSKVLCALADSGVNLIAQMKAACDGDLSRVVRVVKLGGFVQAGPDFFEIPPVVNGASDLMVAAFGDAGKHARSAVGVYRLPMNFAVEVDAVVAIS